MPLPNGDPSAVDLIFGFYDELARSILGGFISGKREKWAGRIVWRDMRGRFAKES